jgi:hypothetical protein
MDWAFILVIILSIFLTVFLLLGIVLVVLLIRVTLQIKKVTTSAEKTASNIESLIGGFSKVGSPMIFGKMLYNQAMKFTKTKRKAGKEE